MAWVPRNGGNLTYSVLALLNGDYKAGKVAKANPVDALRSDWQQPFSQSI